MKLVMAAILTLLTSPAASDVPPALGRAQTPRLPVAAIAGGEVRLEAQVAANGKVSGVKVLRDTAPFTDALVEAVKAWQFEPPDGGESRPATNALVVGLFRARGFDDRMAPGSERAAASRDVPLPRKTVVPPCPVGIVADAVVILEVEVSSGGQPGDVRVVAGEAPFADAATESVRRWTFRPAEGAGQPVSSRLWVVVGFRAPVLAPPLPPDESPRS
jgi:TonB family protein